MSLEKDEPVRGVANVSAPDSELGTVNELSSDALQLASLGHHEELGKLPCIEE